MQALYSGFSYALSEAKRATKPVIETLTPILPTFGYGEAAVKQSVSSCIHEMESEALRRNQKNFVYAAWRPWFENVIEVKLYPASRPSQLNQTENCHIPSEQDWTIWGNVTSNINQQLASWHIPFRFNISTNLFPFEPNSEKTRPSSCKLHKHPEGNSVSIFVRHCDHPMVDGEPIGGSMGECLLTIKTDSPKAHYAHELAHIVSPHTFAAIPLASVHPDLLDAMCDAGAHGDEMITSLSYWNHCRDAGYPGTATHVLNSTGEWGPIDLTMAKLASHKTHDAIHAQIHAEGVDKGYEWIRQNYGARAAEQFVGSFVKSIFIHTMSAVAVRTFEDKRMLRLSKLLIHTIGNALHLGMMKQINTDLFLMAGIQVAGLGLMGKTAHAMIDVMGEVALLRSFVQMMRGNSDTMLQLVYATCGTAAGNLFSQMIFAFIERCAPTDSDQRNAYINMSKPTGMWGLISDEVKQLKCLVTENDEEMDEYIYSHMPSLIQRFVEIDKAVANVIEQYVSLQVMTSWIWKSDQQKADAKVQASVEQLSDILGEVKTKFGPSDLPRVPTNTRSFGLTQPVPPLDLDRETDDDPLLFMDGTAVTGIGNASLAKNQRALQERKEQ